MGIRKFLLKPVDKEELAVAIRSALDATGTAAVPGPQHAVAIDGGFLTILKTIDDKIVR